MMVHNGGASVNGGGGGDAVAVTYDSARRRFEELLEEFLKALNYLRLFPPRLGADGKEVDLCKLFILVNRKGGFDAVSDRRVWGLVGEKIGLGLGLGIGPCVKLVYGKYLSPLDTWMKNIADGGKVVPECDLVGDADRDKFGRCLMELKAEVKGLLSNEVVWEEIKGEAEGNGEPMEVLGGFDHGGKMSGGAEMDASDAVNNNMPGFLSEGAKCDGDGEKSGCKRKRQFMFELLRWVAAAAKNPFDPAVGLTSEKPKWNSCSNQEALKQLLLFRKAAFFKKVFESSSEQQSWQTQKMHPSMYDDPRGPAYNFRERPKCSSKPSSGKHRVEGDSDCSLADKELLSSSDSNPGIDGSPLTLIPLGSSHQVEIPEWTGLTAQSDSKWPGTQVWPLQKVNSRLLIERDPIGKGRQDLCGCSVPGSVECVRFHIAEKRAKVKLELGMAFSQWNFDKTGEDARLLWTDEEEKKFKDAVKSDPPPSEEYLGYFWDQIFKAFPQKSTADLVNYYFNVFLLQRRGHQNRHTPDDINSDDDESKEKRLREVFGRYTPKSRGSITLKKPQPKRRSRK